MQCTIAESHGDAHFTPYSLFHCLLLPIDEEHVPFPMEGNEPSQALATAYTRTRHSFPPKGEENEVIDGKPRVCGGKAIGEGTQSDWLVLLVLSSVDSSLLRINLLQRRGDMSQNNPIQYQMYSYCASCGVKREISSFLDLTTCTLVRECMECRRHKEQGRFLFGERLMP